VLVHDVGTKVLEKGAQPSVQRRAGGERQIEAH